MKKLLFLIALAGFTGPVFSQDTARQRVVDCVLPVLKMKNDSAILQCMPPREDVDQLIDVMMEYIKEQEQIQASVAPPDKEALFNELINEGLSDVKKVKKAALDGQVNWDSVRVDSIVFKENKILFGKTENCDISIYCSHGNMRFRIFMKECMFLSGRWWLMDGLRWVDM